MRPVTPIHGDLHLVLLASWDSNRVPRCRPAADVAAQPESPWRATARNDYGPAGRARDAGAHDALRCRGAYRF
jgi:hypothetical protein